MLWYSYLVSATEIRKSAKSRRKLRPLFSNRPYLGLPLPSADAFTVLPPAQIHPLAMLLPFHVPKNFTDAIEAMAKWQPLVYANNTLVDGRRRLFIWTRLRADFPDIPVLKRIDVDADQALEKFLTNNVATFRWKAQRAAIGLAVVYHHYMVVKLASRHSTKIAPVDQLRHWCGVSRRTMLSAVHAASRPGALQFLSVVEGHSRSLSDTQTHPPALAPKS
jgi:hypothetical protein